MCNFTHILLHHWIINLLYHKDLAWLDPLSNDNNVNNLLYSSELYDII